MVKTEFSINLLGHIVTDTVNALPFNTKKYSSKTNLKFTGEIAKK
jgi:hypothetical protein